MLVVDSRVGDNLLTSVEQGALDSLASLVEVHLENNLLTFFPALASLPVLTTLDLSNNLIRSLGYNAFNNLALTSL